MPKEGESHRRITKTWLEHISLSCILADSGHKAIIEKLVHSVEFGFSGGECAAAYGPDTVWQKPLNRVAPRPFANFQNGGPTFDGAPKRATHTAQRPLSARKGFGVRRAASNGRRGVRIVGRRRKGLALGRRTSTLLRVLWPLSRIHSRASPKRQCNEWKQKPNMC